MKLKRFVAPDTRSAMQQIKATFGPDAVILSSSRVEGGVEIVAAVDFDETVLATSTAIATAEPSPQPATKPNTLSPLDDMRQEILTLRGMLEAQLRGHAGHGEPLHTVLMQKLLYLGVSQVTASSLVTRINPSLNQQRAWQQVLTLFSEALAIRDSRRIEEGGIYAFVGPTGVGKTTTLAKIAARFALRFGAEKLGLVTMDTYRIAAQEQLMLYGKILGVQVCVAQDEVALTRVIRQLNDKKLILIDTAGMNPADERVETQMDILSSRLHSISVVLVLQATNHYQVLIEAIRRFQVKHIEQCIITKLDESLALGGILSAIAETGIEVSYLTHGQRVPEDIKLATRHQLIEQLSNQELSLGQLNGNVQKASRDVAGRYYVEE
ncbi:flagellar biosynthesis protein FlhF [Legionella drozanskii]|uniref:Flagellar biosynthesis protein FlhF n=1 Tax=Legionella drozanskii LLAP-1 TaxID=1212489 RepID=A0A0W0SQT9_9GAMM|nr:flagellar biosynthesis protein FlhF [Legionella drozanskii]KTC85752.1 flagellar GTP-binding protein FlhF [Legionella drozanskii LLAP-1]